MRGYYEIAEWFGVPFRKMSVARRKGAAHAALGETPALPCPFQHGTPPCSKKGGVCSISSGGGMPVIVCPKRFYEGGLVLKWAAEVCGIEDPYLAREVPIAISTTTGKAAGRIDMVLADGPKAKNWCGIELQAVYFSGKRMEDDFRNILACDTEDPPAPIHRRRPDWRSSSAKRLAPQLRVRGPLFRTWGKKMVVVVDQMFFESVGGATESFSRGVHDGDVVWLVPRIGKSFKLEKGHWEILLLEDTGDKLQAAKTVERTVFKSSLLRKLKKLV